MFKVVVAHSNDPDSPSAIQEVIDQCLGDLDGVQPQAGLLLAALDFDHALLLARLQETFPDLQLIGGTTDGEMSSVLGFEEDSITLMLFCSDTVNIRAGVGVNVSQNVQAASRAAVEQACAGNPGDPKLCITIPDGMTVSGVAAISGLKQALGPEVAIVGGTAGDQWNFSQTYQFFGDQVLSDAIVVLLFSGDLKFSHGVASGWYPMSRKAVVTKAEGALVYEIDHRPAVEFYDHYLNGLTVSGEYPLAVFDQVSDEFYLRASNAWDREQGTILFMGDVPEGATVQITHTTCDDIIAATKTSIEKARSYYPGEQPAAIFLFSCAARRRLLGTRTCEEYELGQQSIGSATPTIGFYTYGEISPLAPGGEAFYHQETLVTLLLGVE
ncbi:FIST signal transduction protein [Alkalinema pantanalense CENA528]|uniref:FIST signal transduction protein n=1 Tax=Alkalinema pantanalense TaxID=1620705 RepID=UPI003D6ED50A